MRFPSRLAADIVFGRAARAIGLRNHPLISAIAADRDAAAGAVAFASANELKSPIIWIAGSGPLEHPKIARVTNTLAASGRHVFLEANGALLRRRIHEFKPSSRLHFTCRFEGAQRAHDLRVGYEGAFRAALEGIRAAKLSGFLICAHLIAHRDSDSVVLTMLHKELHRFDLDGFLISPAEPTTELETIVAAARRRLLTRATGPCFRACWTLWYCQ